MDDFCTGVVRRSVAAMNLLISGPTLFGSLDPAHVLSGAGPAFTPVERERLGAELVRYDRHVIYQELTYENDTPTSSRIQIASPVDGRARWFEPCIPWTSNVSDEVALMPMDGHDDGCFVNHGGALKYVGRRPRITAEGYEIALKRFGGIVDRLSDEDVDGQLRDDVPGRGVRFWQRRGFRIRENGSILSPDEALHTLRTQVGPRLV